MTKTLVIALLMLATSAQARWLHFENNKNATTKYFYEDSSITWDNNNGLVQIAWVKAENSDGSKDLLRIETHCPGRNNRVVKGTTYNSLGDVINSMNYSTAIPWEPIIPFSIGDSLYKKLCLK